MEKSIFLVLLFFIIKSPSFAQNNYFSGVVEYQFFEYNNDFKSKEVFKKNKTQGIEEEIAYFQGGNFMFRVTKGEIIKIFGGKISDILVKGNEKKHLRLEHQDSTAYLLIHQSELDSNLIPKAIATGKEKSILGYACIEYEVETISFPARQKTLNYIWVSKDFEIEKVTEIQQILGFRCDILTGYAGIRGLILEATLQADKAKIVIKASKIKPQRLEESIFQIPSGYKQKEERQY